MLSLDRLNDETSGVVFDDHELADVLMLVNGPQLVKSSKHLLQVGKLFANQVRSILA